MTSHNHDHDDTPGHAPHRHAPANYNKAFAIGVTLNVGFVVIEVVFGLIAGSLALLADAGHNLSDVLGLLLAWGASHLAQTKATKRRTYGLRRSSILAALFNALILLAAIGIIAWEAVRRFISPQPVEGATVIWIAAVGVVINTATALLFMSGRQHDLNIKGAFLHMAADAGISLGVVVAGVAILYTGLQWIDPVVSLVIVLIILIGTWGLLRDSMNLALDAVPPGIDFDEVERYLQQLPEVVGVHDLHIWSLSTTDTALTAHLVKRRNSLDDALLTRAAAELDHRFHIGHTTLQLESADADHPCPLNSEDAV